MNWGDWSDVAREPITETRRMNRSWHSRLATILCLCLCLWLLNACALVEDVPPVADAGKDQTNVKLGSPITLDATKSREIDGGKIVEYRWTIVGVPKGKEGELNRVLATTTDPTTVVQLPAEDSALGVWTLELRVTDDGGNRAANEVHITLIK